MSGGRPPRRLLANAIRALAMDAVEQARSGHPGAPMGLADVAEVLWNDFLRHDPADPAWPDRDRFVLSNGHASMLLYALLHLTGYELPIDELRRFRQLGSRTPGHPEHGLTPGVETTTGPLGQGFANAVGMALAERLLAARYNRPGHSIVDHFTYVFVGDGCLMEGISHEAASLAGTLGLGKLIALYDDNGISIDGPVSGWFADDTPGRFRACGWHVIPDIDGHDPDAIHAAIAQARAIADRPSLVCCRTIIGYGAPTKQGTAAVHGAPLGAEEVARAREQLGWHWPPFEIPEEVYAAWDARERGAAARREWQQRLAAYRAAYPELAAELERRLAGRLPEAWEEALERHVATLAGDASRATRQHSRAVLDAIAPALPELVVGSADLSESNGTRFTAAVDINADPSGNYLHYGVREFAMTAVMSGLALHGGFIPCGGTFLVFSDYARSAVRLAAMMGVGSVLVYTHDSIGLGEDGPTHQPVEQLASLRVMPNLDVWRPCDALETAVAWRAAIARRDGPTALVLTRQAVPEQPHFPRRAEGVARGGYVLRDSHSAPPDAMILASGSEVALAMAAAGLLADEGMAVRVVSLPSLEVFRAQPAEYREAVLPPAVTRRVAVEAAAADGWRELVGERGTVIGIDRFGASAPGPELYRFFGLTAQRVAEAVRALG